MKGSDNIKSYALYLRKSRSDPEDESLEETLEKHKEILLKFSKVHNFTISKIYFEVVSGDGLFVRPEMIRLLNDIEKDTYTAVICMDIDRLGRVDTKDRGIIIETLKEHNCRIITPQKTYDLNDEIDEFSTEMQMLFARQELKKITKRLRTGIMKTAEDGYHVGEPPYGYRRTYIDKKPTLKIHEEEAQVVRMIFDMYVNQHIGSHTIADRLNALGYSPRKADVFSRNSVRWILSNPIYIGKIMYNRKKRIKKKYPTDKSHYTINPKKDWIVSKGIHPAIISEELFKKAQQIRTSRTHPPSFSGAIMNPLAGLIYCANCGKIMLRQTSKKTPPRLLCNTAGCNKSTLVENVEKRVLQILVVTLQNLKGEPKTVTDNSDKIAIKNRISACKKHLTSLEQQKNNLYELLEQKVYDVKTFTKRNKILTQTISTATEQLNEYKTELSKTSIENSKQEIIPTIEYLISNYDILSPAEKNLSYKKILERIEYKCPKESKSDFELNLIFKKWL